MHYVNRQKKIKRLLASRGIDALLVRKKENISYLTRARGEDSVLVVSGSGNYIVTDARYTEEYSLTSRNCSIVTSGVNSGVWLIRDILKKDRAVRVGFEPDIFTYSEIFVLKKRAEGLKFIPTAGLLESLRAVKDPCEIRYLRKACEYGLLAMSHGLKNLNAGHTERSLKREIKSYLLKKDIEPAGFDIMVVSGRNSSMPHASATDKKIKRGEIVIIDLGAKNYGYNSDLTRTSFLGRIERKYSEIYRIVLDAQKKAIENIKPGVRAGYIDNISRSYIYEKGFGKYFVHSLGHGVGLEAHEQPRLSPGCDTVLRQGMVVTVEPGIYIPGWGGVRIEDVVLITKDNCEILTGGVK
jgi:Xaa-Pro aminopeptidase